jgi:hypothetical protein
VSDAPAPETSAPGGSAAWFLWLPLRVLSAALNAILSQRGLALLFLLAAAGLVLASGLRPPLSQDISSLRLPIGVIADDKTDPETLLRGSGPTGLDCAGIILLAVIATGTVVVLWRPRWMSIAAGLLTCSAVAVYAAVILNHPALVELMDLEYDHSQVIARTVASSPNKSALTTSITGRLADARPGENEQRADALRGWTYLLYGQWLVAWGAVGILFGGRGSTGRRLVCLSGWLVAGVGLAGGACYPRLQAEYHWNRAKLLESAGDFEGARHALDDTTGALPETARLVRTCLLAGKLDYRLGMKSHFESAFRAFQLARSKTQSRVAPREEDLPWRAALSTQQWEWRRALGLLSGQTMAAEQNEGMRHLTAQIWTDVGASYYDVIPELTDFGFNYFPQKERLSAAEDAWARAQALEPARRDCAFSIGVARQTADPAHPGRLAEALAPARAGLADRIIRADILNALGDGYFRAGEMLKSRRYYAESSDAFSVPTHPNRRAQKGIGGGQ